MEAGKRIDRRQMERNRYLLDIRELLEADRGADCGALFAEALEKVDSERRRKLEKISPKRARAASLGAGLLLQYAVRRKKGELLPILTVSQVLDKIHRPLPLEYGYGTSGKPYLKNFPLHFNLSHSGDYVLCVTDSREVGADIQLHREGDVGKLAERFFSEEEQEALSRAEEKRALFFRLWARKEAYGKLTGQGVGGTLGACLLPGREDISPGVFWEEYPEPKDYSIAICGYERGSEGQTGR